MEMRSGARTAPVCAWRCFLRGYVGFYAQATVVQEENQIGRGATDKSWAGFRAFLVDSHGRFFGLLACLSLV